MEKFKGLNQEDIGEILSIDNFHKMEEKIAEKRSPNVREYVNEEDASPEKMVTLGRIRDFCNELTEQYKINFLKIINDRFENGKAISKKIADYIKEKGFDEPSFVISDSEYSNHILEDIKLEGETKDYQFLLIFNLPKPLAIYWWKNEEHAESLINWGDFYRELMGVVWQAQGKHENENYLDFARLNDYSQHDPEKYYYVWNVSEQY